MSTLTLLIVGILFLALEGDSIHDKLGIFARVTLATSIIGSQCHMADDVKKIIIKIY